MNYFRLKQAVLILGFCIHLALGVTSCGDDETPTPAPTVAPTAAPTDTSAPPTATTAAPTAAAQTVTNTQPLTSTAVNTASQAASQPQSPLAAPKSPLAVPQSPLPTPTKSALAAPQSTADAIVQKILSDTATLTDVTSGSSVVVVSGIDTISAIAKTTKAKDPVSGKASVSGVLFEFTTDHSSDRVIPNNLFYLTPAVVDGDKVHSPVGYHGPQEDKGDIKGVSNLKGQIFLNNIPPGKYYLVVQKQPYDWYLGFESAKAPTPELITLKAGDKLDLGLLYVRGQ